MMKSSLILVAVFFAHSSFGSTLRESEMNKDIQINQTLYSALVASVGADSRISQVGDSVTLKSGLDRLVCKPGSCKLSWDSVSSVYPQSTADFSVSLFNALNKWATGSGATDVNVHRMLYSQTGSVVIDVAGMPGSNDLVQCSSIRSSVQAPSGYIECSLVVSDYSVGRDADASALFQKLSTAKSRIPAEIQALLTITQSKDFLPSDSIQYGNGMIEVTHTLSTGLLMDSYAVAKSFAYQNPIEEDGQIVSHGIKLIFVGNEKVSGVMNVDQVQSQSYVLSHIIP